MNGWEATPRSMATRSRLRKGMESGIMPSGTISDESRTCLPMIRIDRRSSRWAHLLATATRAATAPTIRRPVDTLVANRLASSRARRVDVDLRCRRTFIGSRNASPLHSRFLFPQVRGDDESFICCTCSLAALISGCRLRHRFPVASAASSESDTMAERRLLPVRIFVSHLVLNQARAPQSKPRQP